ncbi:hypothetical protein RhiLY_05030 [Ceratobasidium sp. AG-Ba]|nr:hypothetical protein RhiLY_05030 [Ceratobasidium sp. AG-Ba]
MWKSPLVRYEPTDQQSNFPATGLKLNLSLPIEHSEAPKPVVKLPIDDTVTLWLFQLDGTYEDLRRAVGLDKCREADAS